MNAIAKHFLLIIYTFWNSATTENHTLNLESRIPNFYRCATASQTESRDIHVELILTLPQILKVEKVFDYVSWKIASG